MIPYVDTAHSMMLFWLRPSRQIRPPIYSAKQSKLRKKRVIRFAVVYFLMLILFVALIAGPVVVGNMFLNPLPFAKSIPMDLLQPKDPAKPTSTETTASSKPTKS